MGSWYVRTEMFLDHKTRIWIRNVVADLFLAAVVALVITVAMQSLDVAEGDRIRTEVRAAAEDGLTLDERIDVFDGSIRRSTLVHLPLLIACSGVVVGFTCRNRGWAWLTAIGSVLPALIMGGAFFIDRPFPGGGLVLAYMVLVVSMTTAGATLRRKFLPVKISDDS